MATKKKSSKAVGGKNSSLISRSFAILGFGFLIAAVVTKILVLVSLEDPSTITWLDWTELGYLVVGGILASFSLSTKK